jgi:hypothetical protein
MVKTSFVAASLLFIVGGAAAQDMRAQYPHDRYDHYPYSGPDSPEAFTGVNRYCGPGEIPQPFPDGTGVRCELPSGGYRYY